MALKNPAANARISGAYAITGTVTDANLANWTLQMRAVGDPTWNTLASGTAAVTDGTFFTLDTTSYAAGQYEFQILAADTAGNSSTPDLHSPVTIDNVRPTVVSAAAVNRNTANVVFSEDLAPGSINKSYFTIAGLTVSAAALQADRKTVALTTSNQTDGETYTVTAKNTAATCHRSGRQHRGHTEHRDLRGHGRRCRAARRAHRPGRDFRSRPERPLLDRQSRA